MVKERNSNFELMRIISMLFIVLCHIIIHGHIIENCLNQSLKFIFEAIEFFIVIHVNSYVLTTGYFQSKSEFKQSKLWSIITSSLFYRIVIVILLTSLGLLSLTKTQLMRELFILNIDHYWFLKFYFFLYIISPILNKLIKSVDKKGLQKIILILFIVFSVIPFITGNKAYHNNGFSLINFIILYFIGAYLRKYPIKNSFLFKNYSKNLYRTILVILFLSFFLINFALHNTLTLLSSSGSVFYELFGQIDCISYSNPIVILQSISYLLFFETLDIKSKFINNVSKTTLGVYMIHDNEYMRLHLYKWLNIDRQFYSYKMLIYVFGCMILIFVVCSIIEFIRLKVFKFIYNRKISTKIRGKYYKYINSLK